MESTTTSSLPSPHLLRDEEIATTQIVELVSSQKIAESGNSSVSWVADQLESYINAETKVLAIDGPTGTGKTTLVEELTAHLTQRGIVTAVLGLDWFLTPRPYRHTLTDGIVKRTLDPADYPNKAWEFDKFATTLKQVREAADSSAPFKLTMNDAYDRATGEKNKQINLEIPENALIIVEGFGSITNKTKPFIDLALRLDVNNDQILAGRLIGRELEKPDPAKRMDSQFVCDRFWVVDHRVAEASRRKYSNLYDLMLDVSDFSNLKLYSLN